MSTYTIGEAAERSGFSSSALRYYERIGLATPTDRTDSGYRVYDDRDLARLQFIARAKQLGCSLEEITDLVHVWDGEHCEPVQRRFHALVTDKIAAAQREVAELTSFGAQLQQAAAQLGRDPVEGPCTDDCACLASATEPPITCSLDAASIQQRIADWQRVLDRVARRTSAADGALRLEFDDVDFVELGALVTAEQQCCSFFSFAVTVDARGIGLEVRAPADALELVASMFGRVE